MRILTIAASLAFGVSLAAPASATTVGEGETFCESLVLSIFSAGQCDHGGGAPDDFNVDLPNLAENAVDLDFEGSGTILGFVADDEGNSLADFPDYANVSLAVFSSLTFTLMSSDEGFDARFTFGDFSTDLTANGSVTITSGPGTFLFGINATEPTNSDVRVESSYLFSIRETQPPVPTGFQQELSPVPLPASSLLLLAGLGGLVMARRRKKT